MWLITAQLLFLDTVKPKVAYHEYQERNSNFSITLGKLAGKLQVESGHVDSTTRHL